MTFDELDARMRVFETAHDYCVLPEMYMVARLDGRSFTRLTREVHAFAAPFDERCRDLMVQTTAHVMQGALQCLHGRITRRSRLKGMPLHAWEGVCGERRMHRSATQSRYRHGENNSLSVV